MATLETGNNAPGVANVDSNYRLAVNLPTDMNQGGFTGIFGSADGTNAVRVPVGASSQGLLGSGLLTIDFEQGFAASAISPSVWKQLTATMTIAVSNNAVVLNAGSATLTTLSSILQSWKQVEAPRGADRVIGWRVLLPTSVMGAVVEIGSITCTGVLAPTAGAFFRYGSDGSFRGVSVSVSGAETSTVLPQPTVGVAHDYVIWITSSAIVFQIDNSVAGTIPIGPTAPSPITAESAPYCVRVYNASATATAQQVHVMRCIGALYGGSYGYDRKFLAALSGDIGSQGVVGASTGSLANWTNSTVPATATLSNTAASYTTLGGQFLFAAVAGAETDYALFGFQVPAQTATNQGRTLLVHGITIDAFNTGAAVATTPTTLQWAVGYDSSAVSLATADGAAAKGPRKVPVGVQSFLVGDGIGKAANQINVTFRQPLSVNAGNYFHVILRMPLGTATASQVIRGLVGIDATWE